MFLEDLLNNLDSFPNNILCDELIDTNSGILEDIYMVLISEIAFDTPLSCFEIDFLFSCKRCFHWKFISFILYVLLIILIKAKRDIC